MTIYYKKGYKYQLANHYSIPTDIKPLSPVKTDYINLTTDGLLVVKKGYAWDGPSGPTFDTKNFMRGSLVHDALYQLLRMRLISKNTRRQADELLHEICKKDKMSSLRAWWVYKGVKNFGKSAANPSNVKKIFTAP